MIDISKCREILSQPKTEDIWQKYSALFTLRTIGTDDAAQVLEESKKIYF